MNLKLTRGRLALAAAALIAGIAGISYAAIPASNGTISACKDTKGALKVIDAEAGQTCSPNQQLLSWNQQGQAGPAGPQGPSGVIQGVSVTGGGPNPSGTTQFLGTPVSVTVPSVQARVLVVANRAFGTSLAPAQALNLFICYQQPPGPVTMVGNGILGLRLPPSTVVPMGMSKILTLPVGQYSVGLCGTGGGANWNNNDWGTTSALVFTQG